MSIVDKKYLSILVDRFFSRYQHEEQSNYVEFAKLWLKHAEESYIDENGITRFSFWKTLSNLDNFIDIDKVPNEVLRLLLEQYADNFKNVIENIPFFVEYETDVFGYKDRVRDEYGNLIYKYDNIRMFLKTSKKFFSSKGSYYAIMYMFKIFGGSLEIIPVERDILIPSNKNHILSAKNPITRRYSHLHGIHPNPYVVSDNYYKRNTNGVMVPIQDWWYTYYTYKIITNLKEDFYKPLLLEVAHPAGMKCIWEEKIDGSLLTGWGYDDWGTDNWGSIFSLSDVAKINISTNDIQFSNTSKNSMSSWRTVEISNVGEQDLVINDIIVGDDVAFEVEFNDSGTAYDPIGDVLPVTIMFGQTVGFKIRFRPTILGSFSTNIVINSNSDVDNTRNIKLSGYCVS
jgi:hypothetical protein